MNLSQARAAGCILAVIVVILDQWIKSVLSAMALAGKLPMTVLPFFDLVLVHNPGISFGMFAGPHPLSGTVLAGATSLLALVLIIWLLRAKEAVTPLALGPIIGGAVGNIIDRLRSGAVVDFLDFHIGALHWPAFNLADSAIFIGVVILALMGIVERKNP